MKRCLLRTYVLESRRSKRHGYDYDINSPALEQLYYSRELSLVRLPNVGRPSRQLARDCFIVVRAEGCICSHGFSKHLSNTIKLENVDH